MGKSYQGLLEHCRQTLKNNVQYVYGAKMQVLSYNQIKNLQNTYGKNMVWDSDLNKAGKMCCDCSGLISSYTGIIRSSSGYADTASAEVSISELKAHWKKYVGWALWLKGHIGIVSDTEGYYYAMDGSARNMVHYPISKNDWVKVIKLCDISYSETEKEADKEMITETYIKVNGKDIKINRILKDGKNYIDLRGLEAAGFEVGYNTKSKLPTINNSIKALTVTIDGEKTNVEAVNIAGLNYVPVRSLCSALGKNVEYADGVVVIK